MSVNVFQNPELYESITLAGVRSPGLCTIRGHKRTVDWDVKAASGQDGATVTRKGTKPCEFSVTFEIAFDYSADVDEEAQWEEFLPVLYQSYESVEPLALDIYHPDLASLDIKSVVVKEIGGLERDTKGGAKATVVFLEYVPPKKKAVGSPKGSKARGADPVADDAAQIHLAMDPVAQAEAELDRVLNGGDGP